ncbi:MAG: IS91 family transposase [Gammaproteobacteria bacterium]
MAKFTIKQILLSNQNWWRFYNQHRDKLRASIVSCITKLLSCKNIIRGYQKYVCSNPDCPHIKLIPHTCKCRACSSCGKKATELWIEKQNHLLPDTSWQHITFTMPCELWDFFWLNRHLLNLISKIAADCITSIANQKNVTPGIFTALHTFGRNLKRNVHIHLSTTTGGLCNNTHRWKKLFFHQATLMRLWRYKVVKLFRDAYTKQQLIIPNRIAKQLNHTFTFSNFLDVLYRKTWIVHCAKPTTEHKKIVRYLGGYFKRPPIAQSKLKHYDGQEVTFQYLDHYTKTYRDFKLSAQQFIARFIRHIPDTGFRMIRYYGFLANRLRGKLLPKVYAALEQEASLPPIPLSYAEMIIKNFNFDPFSCILCGHKMVLCAVDFGKLCAHSLLQFHRALALLKKC